jgi:diguanylate cyclase (GGDEF)-like protein
VQPGATFDLASTYCCHTLVAQAPVGFHLVRESTIRNHPCYRNFRLEAYLGAPVYVGGDVVGTLNFSSSASCEPFTADDMALVTLFAQWIGHVVAEERARANLERLATVDSLTGVLNRGAVMERLGWQVAHARRTGQPLSVVMLDIDRFKSINDSWGHDAGERVLRGLGKLCLGVSREIDICGRLGGEEFLLVLPATDLAGAKRMCQRLVRALRWQEVELPTGEVLTVTASVGVAALAGPEEDAEGLLARADGAMYAAKAGGRDQVRLAS